MLVKIYIYIYIPKMMSSGQYLSCVWGLRRCEFIGSRPEMLREVNERAGRVIKISGSQWSVWERIRFSLIIHNLSGARSWDSGKLTRLKYSRTEQIADEMRVDFCRDSGAIKKVNHESGCSRAPRAFSLELETQTASLHYCFVFQYVY